MILTLASLIVLPISTIVGLCIGHYSAAWLAFSSLLGSFGSLYCVVFFIGLLLCITEWKKIKCSGIKKILYLFTFPLYMLTYVLISIRALFGKVEWKPIVHTANISIDELNKK